MVIHYNNFRTGFRLHFSRFRVKSFKTAIHDQGRTSGKDSSWLSKAANICRYWRRYVRELWILTQSLSGSCKGLSTEFATDK